MLTVEIHAAPREPYFTFWSAPRSTSRWTVERWTPSTCAASCKRIAGRSRQSRRSLLFEFRWLEDDTAVRKSKHRAETKAGRKPCCVALTAAGDEAW